MEHKCSAIRTLANFKIFMEICLFLLLNYYQDLILSLVQKDFKIDASLGSVKY